MEHSDGDMTSDVRNEYLRMIKNALIYTNIKPRSQELPSPSIVIDAKTL